MKVTFVRLFWIVPLIVTIAFVVGSELITSLAGWGGICGDKAAGHRRTNPSRTCNDLL
jgi:hypothetical protein